ncbi:NADH-quinone oxidoreductase subunit C [Gammaproteobacteria bacterium]
MGMISVMNRLSLAERLRNHFEDIYTACIQDRGQFILTMPREHLLEVGYKLRDEPDLRFDTLMDLCGVDYLTYGEGYWKEKRFAVVYQLLSIVHNERIRLKIFVEGDPPIVDSVIDLWRSADWFEREAFDLFGIVFDGHPDLRRILTDYGFIGYPLRKDFPLVGNVEMRYDPACGRVVYQPVTIEQRTLVPRVIRKDNRYAVTNDGNAGMDEGD